MKKLTPTKAATPVILFLRTRLQTSYLLHYPKLKRLHLTLFGLKRFYTQEFDENRILKFNEYGAFLHHNRGRARRSQTALNVS